MTIRIARLIEIEVTRNGLYARVGKRDCYLTFRDALAPPAVDVSHLSETLQLVLSSYFPSEYVRGFAQGFPAGKILANYFADLEWQRFTPEYCNGYVAGCLAALQTSAINESTQGGTIVYNEKVQQRGRAAEAKSAMAGIQKDSFLSGALKIGVAGAGPLLDSIGNAPRMPKGSKGGGGFNTVTGKARIPATSWDTKIG